MSTYAYALRTMTTIHEHDGHSFAQWSAATAADLPEWVSPDNAGLVCHTCGIVYVDAVRGAYPDVFATAVREVEAAASQITLDVTSDHARDTYRDGLAALVRAYRFAWAPGDDGSTLERQRVADTVARGLHTAAKVRLS